LLGIRCNIQMAFRTAIGVAYQRMGRRDMALEPMQTADELYLVVIQRFPASPVAEHARQARTRIAQQSLRAQGGGSPRPDVVTYIAQALATFNQVGPQRRQDIAVEVALKGQGGLDINDPEPKHTLKSLPGQFSALHLVSEVAPLV
jgi:hypothetical protein